MDEVYGERASGGDHNILHALRGGSQDVARLACTYGTRTEAQEWLRSAEQHAINHLGLDQASYDAMLAYGLTHGRMQWGEDADEHKQSGCGAWALDELGNKDGEDLKKAHIDLVCAPYPRMGFHWAGLAWWLDRRPELASELERAALIHRFVGDGPGLIGVSPDVLKDDSSKLAKWVFIREDALAFDRDKALAELNALDLPEYAKVNGAMKLAHLDTMIERTDGIYDGIATKLPELAEAFAAAEAASADWSTAYAANTEAIEQAYELEQGWLSGRKSAMEGCTDKLRAHFGDYARAHTPSSPEDVEALASDPIGYLLLSALYRCEADLGNEHNAATLGRLVDESAKQRGPRTASVVAAIGVVGKAKADFDRFPYEAGRMMPWGSSPEGAMGNPSDVDWAHNAGRSYHSFANAVVKTATASGDRVQVVFRTERYQVPTFDCVETGKIDRIAADGRIIYRRNCTKTGSEWRSNTEEPIAVDKEAADGIKPGAYVRIRREGDLGHPIEVYSDAAKTKLVSYFGVPLQ